MYSLKLLDPATTMSNLQKMPAEAKVIQYLRKQFISDFEWNGK